VDGGVVVRDKDGPQRVLPEAVLDDGLRVGVELERQAVQHVLDGARARGAPARLRLAAAEPGSRGVPRPRSRPVPKTTYA